MWRGGGEPIFQTTFWPLDPILLPHPPFQGLQSHHWDYMALVLRMNIRTYLFRQKETAEGFSDRRLSRDHEDFG